MKHAELLAEPLDDRLPPDDVTGHDCMLMSEPSLAKLWDTPEEDAAWRDL